MPIDELGLVERLNEEAQRLSCHSLDHGSVDAGIASNLASEAAAAIERLLAERDESDRAASAMSSDLFRMADERDKLKEALTKIDAAFQNAVRGNRNFERDLGWTGSQDNMGEIFAAFARQALQDSKP